MWRPLKLEEWYVSILFIAVCVYSEVLWSIMNLLHIITYIYWWPFSELLNFKFEMLRKLVSPHKFPSIFNEFMMWKFKLWNWKIWRFITKFKSIRFIFTLLSDAKVQNDYMLFFSPANQWIELLDLTYLYFDSIIVNKNLFVH